MAVQMILLEATGLHHTAPHHIAPHSRASSWMQDEPLFTAQTCTSAIHTTTTNSSPRQAHTAPLGQTGNLTTVPLHSRAQQCKTSRRLVTAHAWLTQGSTSILQRLMLHPAWSVALPIVRHGPAHRLSLTRMTDQKLWVVRTQQAATP